jgi:hypothetical protein
MGAARGATLGPSSNGQRVDWHSLGLALECSWGPTLGGRSRGVAG